MSRNLSFKTDDEFDDKLYSLSRRKGMTKSAFIKHELGKIIESETGNNQESNRENRIGKGVSESISTNDAAIKIEIEKPVNVESSFSKQEEKKIEEKKPETAIDVISNTTQAEPAKINEDKKDDMILNSLATGRLNLLVNEKPDSNTKLINQIDFIKEEDLKSNDTKDKPLKTRRRNMNDEVGDRERYSNGASDEERIRKFLQKQEFEKAFKDMHVKVDSINSKICEDGKCTKEELANLKKDINELKNLKQDLAPLSKLDKLNHLETKIDDIGKKIKKVEICPDCGEESLLHLSSFCSNCGTKVNEWTDDSGIKIPGWKPYWLRNIQNKK